MISNCGHDENGRYHGGKAGDQTGSEWELRSWYDRPWDCVLEPPSEAIGNDLATLAIHAANNNLIGYDQYERTTFYKRLMLAPFYDPANIKVACETDCSAGVIALVAACGKRNNNNAMAKVSKDCYTGNLAEALVKAGFKKHTESKYRTSDAYLGKGWVLLNEGHHTAINVSVGSKYSRSSAGTTTSTSTAKKTTGTAKYPTGGYTTVRGPLNVRTGPSMSYTKKLKTQLTEDGKNHSNSSGQLLKGTNVTVSKAQTDSVGNVWGKIPSGWICLEYKGTPYVKKR